MQITWTNCAEKMPPEHPIKLYTLRRIDNKKLFGNLAGYCIKNLLVSSNEYEWTEFTEEKWGALSK